MIEEQFSQLIEANGLSEYRNTILKFTKNTIFIKPKRLTNQEDIRLGHSKMGGNPDLPADFVWPSFNDVPLTFLAQFRLSDLTIYDSDHLLPTQGVVYFFYEASSEPEGIYEQREGHRTIFYEDETLPLIRHIHPTHQGIYLPVEMQPPCQITFENGITAPQTQEIHDNMRMLWNKTQENNYMTNVARKTERTYKHQLLGIPHQTQREMREDCVRASNNLDWATGDAHLVMEAAKDWILLFQIDSDGQNLNTMWGDAGMVYFWIRKQDLQIKAFDKTWAIMQCY